MAEEPAVAFAFSPALAIQGILDYTRSKHSKIYKSAIREVCKEPFDCEAEEGLYQLFLKDVQDRADKKGWSHSILNVTLGVDDDNYTVHKNLIKNNGTISLGEQGREAQDTYILYSVSWHPCRVMQRRGCPFGPISTELATTRTYAAVWHS
jgi:hypothetical protein